MANSPNPTDLLLALKHVQVVNYVQVSSLSILLYEYFITLDLEIKYIWKARWTHIKIIYLTTRYLPFVDTSLVLWKQLYPHLSAKDCHNLFIIIVWLFIIGMSIAEVIYLACWTSGYVLVGRATTMVKFDIQDLTPRGCLATGGVDTLRISIAWAILLVYDIVIMILMFIPAVNAFRHNGASRLTRVMYRDGISLVHAILPVLTFFTKRIYLLYISYRSIFGKCTHWSYIESRLYHYRRFNGTGRSCKFGL
ncbi:hypothetical protein BDQ17DRAFT_1415550 [Cyathus striatus]|nr:hypothetical protein BDQ17DRAFT_1415550 [Cyathus striatus]